MSSGKSYPSFFARVSRTFSKRLSSSSFSIIFYLFQRFFSLAPKILFVLFQNVSVLKHYNDVLIEIFAYLILQFHQTSQLHPSVPLLLYLTIQPFQFATDGYTLP